MLILFNKSFIIIDQQDSSVLGERSKVTLVSLWLSHGRWKPTKTKVTTFLHYTKCLIREFDL